MHSQDQKESDRHGEPHDAQVPEEAPVDVAERPGDSDVAHTHADELADEWGEESFPASDPPAHY